MITAVPPAALCSLDADAQLALGDVLEVLIDVSSIASPAVAGRSSRAARASCLESISRIIRAVLAAHA